jgi:sugar phosphate isomerase/epimerase
VKFGVCGDPMVAGAAAQASYDFAEWSVGALLKPRESDEAFRTALAEARAAKLPYPVVNCFVPGDLKITGPEADLAKLRTYVATACKRAEQAGVEVIVFGSGGARQIPEGFDAQAAHRQLVAFGSMVAPIAGDHGVVVVVEPLGRAECNVIHTVAEGAVLVREVAHPAFRLLVDSYHMMRNDDSCDDIVTYAGLLSHVHIATCANRLTPGAEPCDFGPFFAALIKGGYKGRVSIEAKINDPAKDLPEALALMKRLAGISSPTS